MTFKKTVKYFEESAILIKSAKKHGTFKNQNREQKGGFHTMVLKTLEASLLGNLLTIKTQSNCVKRKLLELVKIFNAASSFKKLWNAKLLTKWT